MNIKLSDWGYTSLLIETKLICDMRCRFCPYPLIEKKGSELSSSDVYKIIDSIDPSDSKFEGIFFQKYNEPLLETRIFDFINYAKNRGFKVQIITNGLSFGSDDIRNKLLEVEPTNLLISVQVIDKHTFANTRGISSSFEEYKKGVFAFLEESIKRNSPTIITIDVACNLQSDSSIFSKTGIITKILGLDRGDPSVPNTVYDIEDNLNDFLKDLNTYNSSFAYDKDKIKKYLDTFNPNYLDQEGLPISDHISVKIKKFIYGRKLSEFYPASLNVGCTTNMLSVDAKGSVTPCCLAYDSTLTLGNIKQDSLKNILVKTEKYVDDIRTGEKMPEICRRCQGEPTRRGSLIASIYWRTIRKWFIKS